MFIKTLNEFQHCSEKLFAFAVRAKAELHHYLTEVAREEDVANPERLADQLHEGETRWALDELRRASLRMVVESGREIGLRSGQMLS